MDRSFPLDRWFIHCFEQPGPDVSSYICFARYKMLHLIIFFSLHLIFLLGIRCFNQDISTFIYKNIFDRYTKMFQLFLFFLHRYAKMSVVHVQYVRKRCWSIQYISWRPRSGKNSGVQEIGWQRSGLEIRRSSIQPATDLKVTNCFIGRTKLNFVDFMF